jgi:hypothetical protein
MQAIHPGVTPMRVPAMRSARRPSKAVYRRRRLVTMFVVVSLSFLAWSGLRQLADTSGDGPLTVAGRSASGPQLITQTKAVVQQGDTLWSIARRMQPTGDVRPLVSELIKAHGGRPLQVGETIQIP